MMRNIFVFALIAALAAGCATMPSSPTGISISNQPHNLPDGAYVNMLRRTGDVATIGIRGVKVLRVEIYARNFIEYPELRQEGELTTFKTVWREECFNFVFLDTRDGEDHFVLAVQRDNEFLPKWLGPWLFVTKDYGPGSCIAVRKNLRE